MNIEESIHFLEDRITRLEAELHRGHRGAELPDDDANGIVRCDCSREARWQAMLREQEKSRP